MYIGLFILEILHQAKITAKSNIFLASSFSTLSLICH